MAYVAAGLASTDSQLKKVRTDAYLNCLAENNRDDYMHASKKPRFTNASLLKSIKQPEQLNGLGKSLDGIIDY